ncbi:MAG: 5-formyltetrahydrofolate cyclo-ligase [Alloprevotella sp.]|nr:5-formyltetrahydrofolate cyclo-ligase [Alloprevotella sp.]
MSVLSKQALRHRIKTTYGTLTDQQRADWDLELAERLARHTRFEKAQTVLAFYSIANEPDTHRLCELWYRQKTLLLPKVEGKQLELRLYEGPDSLTKGAYGIMEPTGKPFDKIGKIDLAIVPGMAFTRNGLRLGRGGGFYDRLLARPDWQAYTIGFCYPFQVVDDLTVEPFDRPVDEVMAP